MCYVYVNQISKFNIALCIILRHWKVTGKRFHSKSQTFIQLGDTYYPIWMDSQDYDEFSHLHGTEYLSVLLCVMHVIEGWSNHLFTLIISYFQNKQSTCNLLVASIQGGIYIF